MEDQGEQWIDLAEKVFDFATYARDAFLQGNMETKRAILMALGQNPILIDGKLSIEASPWLKPIGKAYPEIEAEYLRLEPQKNRMDKRKTEAFASVRTGWLPGRDSNPQPNG